MADERNRFLDKYNELRMYVLSVCFISMFYQYVLSVCFISMFYQYVLSVCFISMFYQYDQFLCLMLFEEFCAPFDLVTAKAFDPIITMN